MIRSADLKQCQLYQYIFTHSIPKFIPFVRWEPHLQLILHLVYTERIVENILLSLSDDSVIDSCSYQRDLFWTTRPSVSVAKLNILHTFVPSQVSQEVKIGYIKM